MYIINFALWMLGVVLITSAFEWQLSKFGWKKYTLPFTIVGGVLASSALLLLYGNALSTHPAGTYGVNHTVYYRVEKIDGKYVGSTKESSIAPDGNRRKWGSQAFKNFEETVYWDVEYDENQVTLIRRQPFFSSRSPYTISFKSIDGSPSRYLASDGVEYTRKQ